MMGKCILSKHFYKFYEKKVPLHQLEQPKSYFFSKEVKHLTFSLMLDIWRRQELKNEGRVLSGMSSVRE